MKIYDIISEAPSTAGTMSPGGIVIPAGSTTAAPTPVPTTVVGSGKTGRPKKIQGSGVVDLFRLTFDKKIFVRK